MQMSCIKGWTAINLVLLLTALSAQTGAQETFIDVPDYTAYVTASALNVRRGPGTGYPVIGRKTQNQSVRVTHHDGSWRRILWDGGGAWVHGAYLRRGSSSTTSSGSDDVNVADYDALISAFALNVRTGPGTGYSVIGTRYRNQRVRVTHRNGSWRRIVWSGGRAAYVHGNYLSKVASNSGGSTSGGRPDINVSDYLAYVSASTLSVRRGPATSYARTHLLARNTPLEVTHHNGSWARVRFFNGSTGYVHRNYTTRGQSVDINDLQQLDDRRPGAAEKYLECMFGKFTSAGSIATKAWRLFRNGVRQGAKKILTSPMIAVNHLVCLGSTRDWSTPEPFSPQSEGCNPAMNLYNGCPELRTFYQSAEGTRIWDAFQFTSRCDPECRLACYYHGKNKRTYDAFIRDPQTVQMKCRYQ